MIDDLVQLPIGLLYLYEYTLSLGPDVGFINLAGKREVDWDIPTDGDLYGISSTTPQFSLAVSAAEWIKAETDATVVLGGIHGTALTKESMEIGPFDAVVMGEGEITFSHLIEGMPFSEIDGIAFRQNGEIIITKPRKLEKNIDRFPAPKFNRFNLSDYHNGVFSGPAGRNVKGMDVLTSRGCPFACHFCASPMMWNRLVRFHRAEYVTDYLDYLHSLGYNDFFFIDDLFSLKRSRLEKICKWLKDHGSRFRCELRSSSATEDLLELLAESDCKQIDYGVETASQKVLDINNKRMKTEDHYRAMKLTRKYGIMAKAYLLVGLPGEDLETIQDTVRFIKNSDVEYCSVNYFVPLPGSEIYRDTGRFGIEIDNRVSYDKYYVAGKEKIATPVYKHADRTIKLGKIVLDALNEKHTQIELNLRKEKLTQSA